VIAPLFYEAIHILVPIDSNIHRLEDLDGHAIVMGSKDSGTRQAAQRLLKDRKFETIDGDWTQPEMRNQDHVLMAVIKSDQLGLADLLSAGTYRILPIENAAKLALSDPMFRVYEFKEGAYRGAVAQATPTLATAALLVARRDAPSRLIEECLYAIYGGPPLTDDMIPRELAAGWQGLPYHPAARRYFATTPSGDQ
jgi:TRAP-type uncharacterized transport system substrate-binding protein